MNTKIQENTNTLELFHSSEQLWFWFIYSKSVQNNFAYRQTHSAKRICELLDVETMITKLYLSGQLTEEQLLIMKKYGDKRRAPHQYIWAENHDAYQWHCAMETIDNAARKNGWIE